MGSPRYAMKVSKLTSAALALAASLAASSCADEEESLIIVGAPSWQAACAVTVPADVFLPRGILDVRFETEYILPLELENRLLGQQGDSQNSGTDNSEVQIVGVDVVLSSAQRPEQIDRLRAEPNGEAFVDFSPSIATNSISGGGSLGMMVTAIPSATSARLAAYRVEEANARADEVAAGMDAGATEGEISAARLSAQLSVLQRSDTFEATVVVRARRTGNNIGEIGEIEAREFRFPIEVCHGCLMSCASCELEIDNDGDDEVDETIFGVCPSSVVPADPTERLFLENFVGLNVGCPAAQDDFFVPSQCGMSGG